MPRRISFSNKVSILNENGDIETLNTSNNSSIKRSKIIYKKKNINSYTSQNAYDVAERMEKEINNPKLLEVRIQEELVVENLLAKTNLFVQINKIYRLSDEAIFYLKKRLLCLS